MTTRTLRTFTGLTVLSALAALACFRTGHQIIGLLLVGLTVQLWMLRRINTLVVGRSGGRA